MKKYYFYIVAILLFGFAMYIVNTSDNAKTNNVSANTENAKKEQNNSETANTTENVQKNDITYGKAQDFTITDLDGNEVSLSDFRGKKVFLNFWATWCPPCKAEMPEIEKVYQETKDSDLVILAVEIGEPLDTVKTFIEDNKYNFKVLLDSDKDIATTYGISAIPTSFFIDEDGNIISKRVGGMTYDEMKEYIDALND